MGWRSFKWPYSRSNTVRGIKAEAAVAAAAAITAAAAAAAE